MSKISQNNVLTLPIFLEFVELKTKVASVFPMTIGILWSIYHYRVFNWLNTLLFVIAVISFDMCTTAINNTMDYKKALDMVYRDEDNVIGKYHLNYQQMVGIIFTLLGFSTLVSLVLVVKTDLLLLPLGIMCFLIGIFYTFGPMPLSRLPLGEVFSGVTMGFGIFFLAIFIQQPSLLLSSQLITDTFIITLKWREILTIIFMSFPLVFLIANIMLANNICDYKQDIKNARYTLVHYLGVKKSILLYTLFNGLPWLLWVLYPIMGLLPYLSLLGLILFPLNWKQLQQFRAKQVKRETFICSIKSFVLFGTVYVITLLMTISLL